MAASGFTPISLYYSTTASAVPTSGNLVDGEIALNTADMKLYAKNSAGTVTLLASSGGATGTVSSVSGTGTVNGLTLTGTVTTSGSLTLGGTLSLVSPPAIGSTTPNTGAFTTLSATTSAEVNGTYPKIYLIETDAATDNKQWWFESNAGVYQARVLNDAISAATTWLSATRSGTTITQVALNASTGGLIHQQINGTNIATVSSTGLGIGTTSPAELLHLSSGTNTRARIETTSTGSVAVTQYKNAAGETHTIGSETSAGNAGFGGSSAYAFCMYAGGTTRDICFGTNGAQRARITSAGLVGIATASPRTTLDVNGNAFIAGGGQLQITGSAGSTGLQLIGQDAAESVIGTMGSQPLVFRTASSEKARFSAAGGFSVGTTSDPGAGAIYATGAITAFFSDQRLKTVSGKIENALDKVAKLSGVYYTFNDTAKSFGYNSDEVQVGVIAQEVEAVLPQIVKAAPFDLDENNNSISGQNYKTVQYEKLTPLLIEAINELRAEVTALKGTI
jgi:hypothetical protein